MSISAILFLVGFAGGSVLAIFRNPFWGLCTYIAVYYLDPHNRWWAEGLPSLRWSLIIASITILATLIHGRRKRDNWLSHGLVWTVFAYVIWMWIQALWAITGSDHARGLEIFTKYLLVLFMVYTLVDSKERLIGFLFVHIMGCTYLSLLALGSYQGGRLDGIGGPGINDANSLGMQLATACIFAAGIYLTTNKWWKWLAAATIPFTLNAIVMTGSRGAFIALVVGGFGLFLMRPPNQMGRIAMYGFVGMLLFGYLASDFFWQRIASVGVAVENVQEADQSVQSRVELIKQQWNMSKAHPFGTGHKGTEHLAYDYLDEEHMDLEEGGRSSHNSVMSSLVDQGFPGLLLWLGLMFGLWRASVATKKTLVASSNNDLCWINAAMFGSLMVYWAAGMFVPTLKAEIYMWLIAGVCTLSEIVRTQAHEDTSKESRSSTIPTTKRQSQIA